MTPIRQSTEVALADRFEHACRLAGIEPPAAPDCYSRFAQDVIHAAKHKADILAKCLPFDSKSTDRIRYISHLYGFQDWHQLLTYAKRFSLTGPNRPQKDWTFASILWRFDTPFIPDALAYEGYCRLSVAACLEFSISSSSVHCLVDHLLSPIAPAPVSLLFERDLPALDVPPNSSKQLFHRPIDQHPRYSWKAYREAFKMDCPGDFALFDAHLTDTHWIALGEALESLCYNRFNLSPSDFPVRSLLLLNPSQPVRDWISRLYSILPAASLDPELLFRPTYVTEGSTLSVRDLVRALWVAYRLVAHLSCLGDPSSQPSSFFSSSIPWIYLFFRRLSRIYSDCLPLARAFALLPWSSIAPFEELYHVRAPLSSITPESRLHLSIFANTHEEHLQSRTSAVSGYKQNWPLKHVTDSIFCEVTSFEDIRSLELLNLEVDELVFALDMSDPRNAAELEFYHSLEYAKYHDSPDGQTYYLRDIPDHEPIHPPTLLPALLELQLALRSGTTNQVLSNSNDDIRQSRLGFPSIICSWSPILRHPDFDDLLASVGSVHGLAQHCHLLGLQLVLKLGRTQPSSEFLVTGAIQHDDDRCIALDVHPLDVTPAHRTTRRFIVKLSKDHLGEISVTSLGCIPDALAYVGETTVPIVLSVRKTYNSLPRF